MIDTSSLPTHLAVVARRLNVAGPEASGDTFLLTSYVTEAIVKSIGIALLAGVRSGTIFEPTDLTAKFVPHSLEIAGGLR